MAVEAAGREETRAVSVEPHVIDAARHGLVFADLVRVAAARRRRLDVHLEELRRTVGPAHNHLVPLGAAIDGLHPAAEHAGRVRRQIADESLRRHVGHLDRHVAAGRKHRLAVGRKIRCRESSHRGPPCKRLAGRSRRRKPARRYRPLPRRSACRRATNCRRRAYRSRRPRIQAACGKRRPTPGPRRYGRDCRPRRAASCRRRRNVRFRCGPTCPPAAPCGPNRRPSRESLRESRPRPAACRRARNRAT